MHRAPSPIRTRSLAATLLLAAVAAVAGAAAAVDDEAARIPAWVVGAGPQRVDGLGADRLEVSVAGTPIPVLSATPRTELDPLPATTLLFDFSLSRAGGVRGVAAALAELVEQLVALGPIEIAVVDPQIRTLLPPTADPERVRQSLDRVVVADIEGDAIEDRRRQLEIAMRADPGRALELAAEAAREELLMLRRQHDQLVHWLATHGDPSTGPRLLFAFSEGLLLDPVAHYATRLSAGDTASLAALAPSVEELGRVANAFGWSVHPILPAKSDETARLDYRPSEQTPVGFRLRLGTRDRADGESDEESEPDRLIAVDPIPWRELARTTGGVTVERLADLGGALEAAGHQLVIAVAAGPGGGERSAASETAEASESPELSVRLDDGERLRAPRSPPGGHPRAVSAALARLALAGELDDLEGGAEAFEVSARLDLGAPVAGQSSATIETSLPLDALAGLDGPSGSVRITHAFETLAGEVVTHFGEIQPDGVEREGSTLRHAQQLFLPSGAARSVVLVEDLESGARGIAFPEVAEAEPVPTSDAVARARAREESFRLLAPESTALDLRGRVTFRTEAADPVERVHFLLNGERVARRNRRPFEARIDLGDSGRTQQLVAVAYDAAGNEIDRDRVVINEPPTSFWVRVIEPQPGSRPAGPTGVEAEVKVPIGSQLRRLTFYWKDAELATLVDPPWRRELTLPIGDPEGFLRAEAELGDGRIAEDVVVMTQKGFGEQIGVDLVDLYVVAVDRNGKPVLGLERDDFEVYEDGDQQQIESFEVAGDLPITVGLAIDSSSSLFVKMPAVRHAAERFADSLVRTRDRAFLIGFGSQPRLIAPLTGNLQRIRDGIRSLEPHGSTAVWGALEMALEQIESVAGRRALVVFYDGDDEDAESSFQRSLALARRARVPIYLILMNNEAARTDGRSLESRAFVSRLDRLARAGGGRVYFVPAERTRNTEQQLDEIFGSIADELRSHYLITYYPELEPGGPLWRPVEVKIDRRGVTARTVEGRETDWP